MSEEEEIFDLNFDFQGVDENIPEPDRELLSKKSVESETSESIIEDVIPVVVPQNTKNPFSGYAETKTNPFVTQTRENPFTTRAEKNPFITQLQTPKTNPFQTRTNPFTTQAQAKKAAEHILGKNPFSTKTETPSTKSEDLDTAIQKRVEAELAKIKRKKKKKNIPIGIKNLIPEGHTVIETAAGTFVVPIYEDMNTEEQRKCRKKFKTLYKSFNISWDGKHSIGMFTEDDSLTDIDIKYQHSIRYVKQQNSFNLPKLMMIVCWGGVEVLARKMGIKANGYFVSQLQMCDVYESKMIQMGNIGGVGEDWPVWLQLVIVSAVNLILMVILNKWCKGLDTNNKTCIMRGVSQFISGNRTSLDTNGDGSLKPSSDPISSAIGMNLGGINLTNIVGSFMGNMFGGGDDDEEDQEEKPKKKRSKRRREKRNKSEATPAVAVDEDGIPEEI